MEALSRIADLTATFAVFLNGPTLVAHTVYYRSASDPFGRPRVGHYCPSCHRCLESHDTRFKREKYPRRVLCPCVKVWVVISE